MSRQSLDVLVKKYQEGRELGTEDAITARREYIRRENERWQDIFARGCNDPAWPDGCNLNLTRNHILSALRGLQDLGEDVSWIYVPPKVDNGLMIPSGRWAKVRCKRFKQMGQYVKVAGVEISLF